jgi:hypothetical protein
MPLRHPAILALLVVLAALATGCTKPKAAAPPPPPTTSTTEPATTTTDIVTVPGRPRTTTTVPTDILGGGATISGTVTGPQGRVATAIVHVERLVGSNVAAMDVVATSGVFNLVGVRGGHYRIRAWNRPDLVELDAQTFFLAADEQKTIDLQVTRVTDLNVDTTVDPNPPTGGDPFTVTLFVYAATVSDQGVVQAVPRPSLPVLLVVGSGLQPQSPALATTDASGRAAFRLRCTAAGQQAADVVVANTRISLALPACPG